MSRPIRAAALAGALFLAAPSFAQTTPEAFFAEYQALLAPMGYSISVAAQAMEGDALVLTDLSYTLATPQAEIVVTTPRAEIRPLAEPGFELAMTGSETMSITTKVTDPTLPDAMAPMTMTLAMPGNVTKIGGVPGARVMAFIAPTMALKMEGFAPDPATTDRMSIGFTVANLNGTLRFTAAPAAIAYDATADRIDYSLDATMTDGSVKMTGDYAGLAFKGEGPMVPSAVAAALFAAEDLTRIDFTAKSAGLVFSTVSGPETVDFSQTSGDSTFSATFGRGQIDYDFGGLNTVIKVAGTALPMPPIDAEIADFGLRIAMPVLPRETAGTAAIGLRLDGLKVSEPVWAMIDPTAVLPRDPATLVLRVTSSARALIDLMNPALPAEPKPGEPPAPDMPFVFENVKVEEITLRLAGATVKATGEATINNAGPVPMPVGGLDVTIEGALGLADKLQTIGVVPPEQAAMAKGVLAAFAVPGAAPDSFTTRIEATADGMITANGVPLQ